MFSLPCAVPPRVAPRVIPPRVMAGVRVVPVPPQENPGDVADWDKGLQNDVADWWDKGDKGLQNDVADWWDKGDKGLQNDVADWWDSDRYSSYNYNYKDNDNWNSSGLEWDSDNVLLLPAPEDETEDVAVEVEVEVEDEVPFDHEENEELIKRTRAVLQRHRHRGPSPVRRSCKQGSSCRRSSPSPVPNHYRSGKQGRSSLPQKPRHPPPKQSRRRRKGNTCPKCAKAAKERSERYAKMDDKQELMKVSVRELRYSQLSIKEQFFDGREVWQLVQDLLDETVSLSAPFMQLSVFETTDKRSKEPVLRCIDNRRLFALKEYAKKKSGKDPVMVNVNLFSKQTIKEVRRFIQNSDETDGRSVRLRGFKRR